jgi:hypothetical protein
MAEDQTGAAAERAVRQLPVTSLEYRFEVTRRARRDGLTRREAREQLNAEMVEAFTAAMVPLREAMAAFVEVGAAWFEQLAAALADIARQHPGLFPPPAPSDPFERAMHAKRSRGTGPTPARLDGRRGVR